ncbi:MAG: hypothetical protein GTO02_09140 [Candidatus Dadabacteria bacterium]|nr:hypothetical protein [Candidatus Dadabacteria bacterium]NIQ14546.1 hypothetical protein [Candidatus Dadabacteria bacterium]
MDILGQILKLTVLSIFFSAGATIYFVDSDSYNNFLEVITPVSEEQEEHIVKKEVPKTNQFTEEEIKRFKSYLRKIEIDDLNKNKNQLNTTKKQKTGSIWENVYEK